MLAEESHKTSSSPEDIKTERQTKADQRRRKLLARGTDRLAKITGQPSQSHPEVPEPISTANTFQQETSTPQTQPNPSKPQISSQIKFQSRLEEEEQQSQVHDIKLPIESVAFRGSVVKCATFWSQPLRLIIDILLGLMLILEPFQILQHSQIVSVLVMTQLSLIFGVSWILQRNQQMRIKVCEKYSVMEGEQGGILGLVAGLAGLHEVWSGLGITWLLINGILEDVFIFVVAIIIISPFVKQQI
eukprot:TRINITY_DN3625_c0_g1_i1.p1 TRINITY_DN3625_c0_g1~~TRINITY_DN3625_c0_g1_i1.p1  ORF type:complete len:264 (-),score=20.97 TRINITY_DN3625_c0_g1_i1:527-1261(-)